MDSKTRDAMRKSLGTAGENMAAELLMGKGYEIICRNYAKRGGEIDIIAIDGEFLVFAEVRTRSSSKYMTAAESVTKAKQRRIIRTAEMFLFENDQKYPHLQPRFDIIEVYTKNLAKSGKFLIRHLQWAFISE